MDLLNQVANVGTFTSVTFMQRLLPCGWTPFETINDTEQYVDAKQQSRFKNPRYGLDTCASQSLLNECARGNDPVTLLHAARSTDTRGVLRSKLAPRLLTVLVLRNLAAGALENLFQEKIIPHALYIGSATWHVLHYVSSIF